ncbi:MAG: UMP kinase [archaeon]
METVVLSLGGSLIAPDKPDYFFLSEFKNFIVNRINSYRFVIVCGGGKTNYYYNEAGKRVSKIKKDDLDWIGIMATRLNAELIRCIFGKIALDKVIIDPTKNIRTKKQIVIAAGWKPGRSTDFVAVLLAKQFKAKKIINLTNVSYVYDKDPRKYSDAKKIPNLSWKEYRKIVGNKWTPRLSTPFDPIASKSAEINKVAVAMVSGKNLRHIDLFLENRPFDGTIIS